MRNARQSYTIEEIRTGSSDQDGQRDDDCLQSLSLRRKLYFGHCYGGGWRERGATRLIRSPNRRSAKQSEMILHPQGSPGIFLTVQQYKLGLADRGPRAQSMVVTEAPTERYEAGYWAL